VHAGADGDEKAVVCALEMNPTQLRIAGLVSVSPPKSGKARWGSKSEPEVARTANGTVVVEPWNPKK